MMMPRRALRFMPLIFHVAMPRTLAAPLSLFRHD